jgi:hypothetical protein
MRRTRPDPRGEQGSALFVAVMLMVLMGLIGFAALDTVTKDQQVAGFLNRKALALYAAEAGVAEALNTLAETGTPDVTTTNLADTTTYPHGQPSYELDPTVASSEQVKYLGQGAAEGMNLMQDDGGPTFVVNYYRVRVQGNAPGGSVARLEVASGILSGS